MSVEDFVKRRQKNMTLDPQNSDSYKSEEEKKYFISNVRRKLVESFSNETSSNISEFNEIKKTAKKAN